MNTIGDASRLNQDGSSAELRFIVDDDLQATVHNSCIADLTVHQNATGVDLLEAQLVAPRGTGLLGLPTDARTRIEIWVHRTGEKSHRLAVVRIDYSDAKYDTEQERLEIHGRSPCAHLIDDPASLEFQGSLPELLRKIAGPETVFSHGVPNLKVSAYIAAPSAYGALRLIASSTGLVVSDNVESFRVQSKQEAINGLLKPPVAVITEKEFLNATMTKGSPIRKR